MIPTQKTSPPSSPIDRTDIETPTFSTCDKLARAVKFPFIKIGEFFKFLYQHVIRLHHKVSEPQIDAISPTEQDIRIRLGVFEEAMRQSDAKAAASTLQHLIHISYDHPGNKDLANKLHSFEETFREKFHEYPGVRYETTATYKRRMARKQVPEQSAFGKSQ